MQEAQQRKERIELEQSIVRKCISMVRNALKVV